MTSFLSINQLITLWFVDAEFPCFSVKFKKLGWWERQYHVKDTSILISTQHVKVVKCLIHIWQTPPGNPRRDDIQQALAGTIARCSLLLLGSDARIIIMLIIQRVWGAKDTIRKNLSGPHRDLALIRQCHVSLSKIAINTTYGQLPTLTMHSSSTMTLSTAIHQAFETSSDHSRIPPLPNTFVRSWHRAPNASTSWSEPTKQYDRSLLHHLWGHRRVLV